MARGAKGGRAGKVGFARQVRRYLKDPSVAIWRKLAGVAAAVYVISPVDVIPDLIPLIGWLDDLGIASAVAWFLVRDIRRHAELGEDPGAPADGAVSERQPKP